VNILKKEIREKYCKEKRESLEADKRKEETRGGNLRSHWN
jgi:hypothetical protein